TTSLILFPVRRIQIPIPKQCLNPANIFSSPVISRRISLRPELFLPFIIIFFAQMLAKTIKTDKEDFKILIFI
ncbi:MAG: hypothetical protein LBH06_05180, partial [Rikenellaceae bacterium]|nr:hypothetical protein [Rikenellaceae bacterium]